MPVELDLDRERELLQRWRSGDVDAGDELIAVHHRGIRRRFERLGSTAEIRELAQRTVSACVRRRGRGRATTASDSR